MNERLETDVAEIGALKRGLTNLEAEQVPAIINPIMKQLNSAHTEIETLKTKLQEKAAQNEMLSLR